MRDGTIFTPIQGSCPSGSCNGYPTAIDDAGTVAGQVFISGWDGFVWQGGAFVAGDFFSLGSQPSLASGPFLQNEDNVAFNLFDSRSFQAFIGNPSAPQLLAGRGLNSNGASVSGMNKFGVVAGTEQRKDGSIVIFFGKQGKLRYLSLPGGISPYGVATINEHGQVAGDTANTSQGFLYSHGEYTLFSMPPFGLNVAVQAINDLGRVIDTFQDDSTHLQHAFLYNGTVVSSVGSYPYADTLHLSMNDHGIILVSDIPEDKQIGTSCRLAPPIESAASARTADLRGRLCKAWRCQTPSTVARMAQRTKASGRQNGCRASWGWSSSLSSY